MLRTYWVLATMLVALAGCGAATGASTASGGGATAAGAGTAAVTDCPHAAGPLTGPLVFGSDQNGLSAMAIDGSNVTVLVKPPLNSRAYDPFWSPDGKTLAYTYVQPSTDPALTWLQVGMICGLDQASGQGRVLVKPATARESVEGATWTADGKGFILTHHRPQLDSQGNYSGDTVTLQRIDAGGKAQDLVQDGTNPMLTPDGQHLVYVHVDPTTNAMLLMVADADGKHAQPLTNQRSAFITLVSPHWSPDGTRIVFTASGGSSKAEITPPPTRSLFDRLLGIDVAAAHGLPSDLWLVDAGGQHLQRLTKKGLDDPRAAWSPDGHSIMYSGGGSHGIFRLDPTTSTEQTVSKLGSYGGLALK